MRANTAAPPFPDLVLAAPAAGELIAGKYRVESVIGEGGMGTVLAAHHELLDVRVAVKLLTPRLVRNSALVDRFLREARAAARLRSEHVARVMDVGTLPGGEPYIVMDLLEGEDLEQRLQRMSRLATRDAVDYLLQALEAMAHAHAAGIIHRDLKPANLFVTSTPDGREIIKVLDFGIAKLTDAATQRFGSRSGALTDEHATLGSPSYMAPEQVRGSRQIDHRADIWALGTILYELMTGHVAFGGQSLGEIFGAVLHENPPPLRTLCSDAPSEVEAVIMRCLERKPGDRFSDVGDVARAIAPFGSGAWVGHVARIQQTLARSGKASFSDASASSAFAKIAAGAETIAADDDEPRVMTGSRRAKVTASVVTSILTAAVVAAGLLPILRKRMEVRAMAPAAIASPATVALPPPPQTPAPTAVATRLAPSVSAASSTPAPPAAPQHNRTTKRPPARVPPTLKLAAPRASLLPGVLESPE